MNNVIQDYEFTSNYLLYRDNIITMKHAATESLNTWMKKVLGESKLWIPTLSLAVEMFRDHNINEFVIKYMCILRPL